MGPPSNVVFQLVFISWMVTLSSWLIWQIINFILPPNEYGCVYAWTTLGSGPAIDLKKVLILAKKSSFQMKLILIFAGMYTSKIVAFGAQKTRTHTLKSRRNQNESLFGADLVQRHNSVIFLRKWAKIGRYSQWRSLSGHVERIFVEKNWRGGHWQHLVSTEWP